MYVWYHKKVTVIASKFSFEINIPNLFYWAQYVHYENKNSFSTSFDILYKIPIKKEQTIVIIYTIIYGFIIGLNIDIL